MLLGLRGWSLSVVHPLTWTTAAVAGAQCLTRRLDDATTVSGDPLAMPVPCATTESSDHPIDAPAPDPGRDRSPLASLG